MDSPLLIGLLVFAVVIAGAFAGWAVRQCLPSHHLTDDTKNLVSVSMAVVATVSALVLGLLISNANSAFIARGGEVTALSAEILRLDRILRRYGPETSLLALKPASPRDQWWLAQAMTLAGKIGDTGWLLAQQVGQGTPKAFVALLVFWLTLLFASFGLFAPPNFTSAVILTLCALAVGGAIGMLLELERAFGGFIHNSPQPMLQAVKALETQPRE